MEIKDVASALSILAEYAEKMELDYVPARFFNGTPKDPHDLYLRVEVREHVGSLDARALQAMGWQPQCDGNFWVLYDR